MYRDRKREGEKETEREVSTIYYIYGIECTPLQKVGRYNTKYAKYIQYNNNYWTSFWLPIRAR